MGGQEGLVVEVLTPAECRVRLSSVHLGRLGMTVQALPVVLPVYFVLDGDAVVIRTVTGTKLSAAVNGSVVAFEVDQYDEVDGFDGTDGIGPGGWSVLVQGRASEIIDSGRLTRARGLPLRSISAADDDHFIAVALDVVTGRRIGPPSSPADGSR